MTTEEIRAIAGAVLRPALGEANIKEIIVREDDEEPAEPSLSVDVFVAPGLLPMGPEAHVAVRRSLTQQLRRSGERRYAYLRIRDKAGEDEEGLPGSARGA